MTINTEISYLNSINICSRQVDMDVGLINNMQYFSRSFVAHASLGLDFSTSFLPFRVLLFCNNHNLRYS